MEGESCGSVLKEVLLEHGTLNRRGDEETVERGKEEGGNGRGWMRN